ncbi:hypothetical protein QOZ80_7AG0579780 [Eleusine coracana subsp. coracana]|nr:hypothetical protein QOZ80_7AG0579780 [Eleusine coracana subsp. coracana]
MAQSISSSAVDEHRVPMPAHIAGQGKKKGATPEKQLNRFVRIVTFIERVGNALGTLAFTWATVVLLGGYPTVLCRGWFRDFWCATAIVFLEATRMFSRNNKMDYQLFFHTKGAFRRFGLHGLIISAAIARVVLALVRLVNNNEYYCDNTKDPIVTNPKPDDSQINLAPSLNIFYGMVLGQGALYVVACIFEIFAFIPRRSLARRSGFGGQWGMELVGLYYAYALEKSTEGDVLAPKNVNFNSFAMEYCLNSDKPNMQLHGIRIMHSLLLREETRKQLFPILINSTKTMARLIEMLDWSRPEKITIRLYAAKVTSELSTGLRVVTIPGIIQVVSALLDYGNQQQRANPLLNTDVEHEKVPDNHEERLDACEDTGNNLLLETREHSSQQVPAEQQKPSKLFRGLQCIFGTWSIPQEEPKPLTEKDLLPALGMSILDGLIGCDQDNCVEISRASGLTMKIIRFTSYGRSDTMYTDTQRKVLMASSLKLLHSLTSIDGEIGVRLRHKVSQNPFLLRNLADVLGDSMSCKELKKLVAGILRNLAIDGEARKVIGHKQVIISRLMHAFLTQDGSSSTESERLPRRVAGQALAMLAMDNANNCLAMDICRHARTELKEHDIKEISYSLREVLERIMVAEAAELEIFIGLSSQICQVIPGAFTRELEQGQIKGTFVKRLIDALNANMEPSADCPGIRRVILQQAISLMECDSRYANFFKDRGMKEALSMVEETASDVENYNLFLGDAGLIEASEPLPRLVARAKELLAVR